MQCKATKPQLLAASTPSVYLCTVLPARCRGNPARHPVRVCRAKRRDNDDDDGGSSGLATVTSTLNSAVDSLTALVPDSVPRNVAKGGVTVVGALVVFGLVKQLISGIFTLVLIGGVGYWWLTKDTKDDDEDDYKPKGKKGKASVDDLGDPLSDAQRIMDKYK